MSAVGRGAPSTSLDSRARVLEAELFGGPDELLDRLNDDASDHILDEEDGGDGLVAAYHRDVSFVGDVTPQTRVMLSRGGAKGAPAVSTGDKGRAAWEDGEEEGPVVDIAARPPVSTGVHVGKRRAVWEDREEEGLTVDIAARSQLRKLRTGDSERVVDGAVLEQRLRGQHRKLHANTEWASLPAQGHRDPDAIDADFLSSEKLAASGASLQDTRGALLPGRLELTRVRDANMHGRTEGVIQCMEFHPSGAFLMTAGFDRRLRFFTADGVSNEPLQSFYFADMPVHTARFASGGSVVVASGRRRFFYVLDVTTEKVERNKGLVGRSERSLEKFVVPSSPAGGAGQAEVVAFYGTDGSMPLVSLRSRQVVGELRMSGTVRAATFSPVGGPRLFTAGGDGRVCVWDVRMQRCIGRFVDEGCVGGSALAASQSYLACGSGSGVVNVYSRAALPGDAATEGGGAVGRPAPLRALTNLVTVVDTLAFSPGGEVLCMASRMKKNSLRLVHVPTLTVFSNWPTSRSPLHYVHCACFSPGGGFLAMGNARGHVLMYRLHHFKSV